MFKKFLIVMLFAVALVSCGKGNSESKVEKEYTEFQADSLKQCTQNERIVKAAVENAFDRIPENNGYWKKDKVTCNYNDSLQLWVGVVDYHFDRNNTYYQSSVKFHAKYWAEQEGNKAKVFYKINQVN